MSSLLANVALAITTWTFVSAEWRATAAALESVGVLIAASLARATPLALSSQLLLLSAYGSLFGGMLFHWEEAAPLQLPILLVIVSLGCERYAGWKLSGEQFASSPVRFLPSLYLWAGAAVVVLSLAQRLDPNSHLWTMTLSALLAFAIGMLWRNNSWRWIGCAILVFAALNWLGRECDNQIDWDEHNVVAGHFLALVLWIGCERLFKRESRRGENEKDIEIAAPILMVIGLAYLLLHVLWRAAHTEYLTAVWTVGGFTVFALGLMLKERAHRLAGLSVVGLSVLRAIFYDFWQIEEPLYRILSFVALGAILLFLGYLYARFREKIARWL